MEHTIIYFKFDLYGVISFGLLSRVKSSGATWLVYKQIVCTIVLYGSHGVKLLFLISNSVIFVALYEITAKACFYLFSNSNMLINIGLMDLMSVYKIYTALYMYMTLKIETCSTIISTISYQVSN